MPPIGNKGKSKVKDNRQSRSRNTTPSSVLSAPTSASAASLDTTAYLKFPLPSLMVPSNLLYDDIVDRNGGNGGIPEPRHLEALANSLRTLSQLGNTREQECDKAVRELVGRRKQVIEDERDREREAREAEEKAHLKRVAEEDEVGDSPKAVKVKKRKEMSKVKEERPLAHGAHGLARQDGRESTPKPTKVSPSPSKARRSTGSGSSSSLSPPSQAQSPTLAEQKVSTSKRDSPAPSASSDDSHQPRPAASVPQYQTFGANPLTFNDPTVYHVREVTDDMDDEEKKEIYSVTSFPHNDLRHLIAGTIPDKDFTNAKPSSQVNANTFATYLEPYFRPLTDEDLAWLRERGDRVAPFLMPRRGNKTYQQIWAEEDGMVTSDAHSRDRLPANQPRGSIEQMDDQAAETEDVSAGPMASRFLSTMRFEHRPEEKEKVNGMVNGDANETMNSDTVEQSSDLANDDRPPATYFAESGTPAWKASTAKQDYAQVDERLKQELRYIGFLGQEDEPDYDAHYDDEVAQRLRFLQSELRKQMIINGARKSRLLQMTEEQMGYQEYTTIMDDLDNQVNQAFSKRNRLTSKGKKNVKRPSAASGYSTTGAGVTRPGIGDMARTLMDRRRRWKSTIEPVFSDDVTKVRGADESIFKDEDMAPFVAAEKERLDEELQMNGLG